MKWQLKKSTESILIWLPWFFCSSTLLLSSMSFSGIPSMPYISSSISVRPGIALGTPSMVSLCTYNKGHVLRSSLYIKNRFYDHDLYYLHTMNCKPRASVQLFMADVALEMFSLLMLNENLFIIKISVTVPEDSLGNYPKNSVLTFLC